MRNVTVASAAGIETTDPKVDGGSGLLPGIPGLVPVFQHLPSIATELAFVYPLGNYQTARSLVELSAYYDGADRDAVSAWIYSTTKAVSRRDLEALKMRNVKGYKQDPLALMPISPSVVVIRVKITRGMTLNLGDYTTASPSVTESVICVPGDFAERVEWLSEDVSSRLRVIAKNIRSAKGEIDF